MLSFCPGFTQWMFTFRWALAGGDFAQLEIAHPLSELQLAANIYHSYEISKVCNSCKVLAERKIRITFAPRNKKTS